MRSFMFFSSNSSWGITRDNLSSDKRNLIIGAIPNIRDLLLCV